MINQDKWINTLTKINSNSTQELDYKIWESTIPKKTAYKSVTKYTLMTILFVIGLLSVSAVKNETRNLQKEINNLEASIDLIKFNLNQATLDNEVITSPENISLLAEKYLDSDFAFYKRSQIGHINNNNLDERFIKDKEISKITNEKIKKQPKKIKYKFTKEIMKKKNEIEKIKKLYSNPETISYEIKKSVAKQTQKKKTQIKNMYKEPKQIITLEKIQKWGAVQVVKAFLGIPVIPGR